MNITIVTKDSMCTQKEGQDCGEILDQFEGSQLVRNYVFSEEKMPKLFRTRGAAELEARKLGYTLI